MENKREGEELKEGEEEEKRKPSPPILSLTLSQFDAHLKKIIFFSIYFLHACYWISETIDLQLSVDSLEDANLMLHIQLKVKHISINLQFHPTFYCL